MKNSQLLKKAMKKGFKFGYFDIETSPELSWHYGHYNLNISHVQTELKSQVTSIVVMNEKDKSIYTKEWQRPKTFTEIFNNTDKDRDLLKESIPILNSYDLLIGQNLDDFDIKTLHGRAWMLGLPALNNILSIDTLSNSRKVFRLASHKLDAMTRMVGIGKKIKQDMDDCIGTAKGDKKISDLRTEYNKRDVQYGSKLFWSQLDYYKLPKKLIRLLQLFIKTNNPTFCINCAAEKRTKFDVTKRKTKAGYKFCCDNCDKQWEIVI